MARKRRRSGSAGAAPGYGPFGFFLVLGAIWLLIQYWWVLLIILSVVGLTRAPTGHDPVEPATGQ